MIINKIALIVAGGSGSRMGTDIPKQFLPFAENTVLMHTIQRFYEAINGIEIILVLPSSQIDFWNQLCKKYNFNILHSVVVGGNSRFQSVKNGLKSLKSQNAIIAIHDGVRPLISSDVITNSFDRAQKFGSAVVAVKPKDSLRKMSNNYKTYSVDRNEYFIIQTPQVFELNKLIEAYEVEEEAFFTDDASVFENFGFDVKLIEGNYDNIKITTPDDLVIANAILKMQNLKV